MKNYSDKAIIQLLKSSESQKIDQGLRILFQKLQSPIIRFLQSKSVQSEDAQAIFNDSAFALVKNAKKNLLDHPDFKIKPYLLAICKKKMANKFKQSKKFVDLETTNAKELVLEDQNQLDFLLSEERKKLIQELLQQIGDNCKTIILGFYYQKQKMNEIAQQMGYANEQVARNKKAKCMKRLKELVLHSNFYRNQLR